MFGPLKWRNSQKKSQKPGLVTDTPQKTIFCTKAQKRKIPPIKSGLLSPLKSLRLSPIIKSDDNYPQFGSVDHLLYDKENMGPWRCMDDSMISAAFENGDSGDFGSIPVLEIFTKDGQSKGDKTAKEYQPYKGQMKLSVYVNYGLLTIHVVQARHLVCKCKDTCDAFVKLSLAPDESRRTRCKTEVIRDTNHPVFDEKFSFELLDEDLKKRLLISVWHRNFKKDKSEFIGCMSFGIQHVNTQKRVINGWYYLLNEDIGRKKHLQVSTKKTALTELSHKNIPKVNQDLLWMEPHVMLIRRGTVGYGFSLTGCSPVRVCSVMPGSLAEEAGLQKDDCIVRVNGMNVSRSSADSIARIVRHSAKKIVLEIQRPRACDPQHSDPPPAYGPRPGVPGGGVTTTNGSSGGRKPLLRVADHPSRKQHPHPPLSSTPRRNRNHHHPDSGAHSDSELEENVRNKLTIGSCGVGTLPRKRVTFKDNAC